MIPARQIVAKAGSAMGLPFLLLVGVILQCIFCFPAKADSMLTFQEIESTCIDLARYDAKVKQMTVRYVDGERDRFYRYSKIPANVWKKLTQLNETGGVGSYFITTVQQHPEKYPFEKIPIKNFKTLPKKKKAGDSN